MSATRWCLIIWSVVIVIYIASIETYCHFNSTHQLHVDLRRMIDTIHAIACKHSLTYWITGGTLLGSIRCGNIIPHDDDIDICIPETNYDEWVRRLLEYGFSVNDDSILHGLSKVTMTGSHAFVDIFRMSVEGGYFTPVGNQIRRMWPEERVEIEAFKTDYSLGAYEHEGTFKTVSIYGPSIEHALSYLSRMYGNMWRIPLVTHVHTIESFRTSFFYSVTTVCALLVEFGLFGIYIYTQNYS